MGYGNWNMWLLKLVWVARNNFACEVYVQPFSEKHVKRLNFYLKCKGFSQKWYLRSVDEQESELFTEEKIFGKSEANALFMISPLGLTLEALCLAVTFLLFFIGQICELLKPVGIFLWKYCLKRNHFIFKIKNEEKNFWF